MIVDQLRSLSLQAVALVALIAHPAFSTDDLELPAGEVMGGFVEDDGTGVLLVRPWGSREDGPIPEDGTSIVRFSRTGTEIEVLPDFAVNHAEVIEDGLFFLGGHANADYGYSYRVVDVGKDEAEVLWDSGGLPVGLRANGWNILKVAEDGSRWGVMKMGFPKMGTERELEFFFGDLDSYEIGREVTAVIPEEHYDPGAISTQYPSFIFLDSSSKSPLLAVAFSDEVFLLRIVGSSVQSEYLEHGKGSDPGTFRWQPADRILWVDWGSEWLGYDLWDLGLSAESPIPATLRKKTTRGYTVLLDRPHRQGGFVSMIEGGDTTLPLYLRDDEDARAPTTVQFSREGFETRSGTLKGRLDQVFVSPNGYYAVAILWRAWGEVRGEAYVAKVFPLH